LKEYQKPTLRLLVEKIGLYNTILTGELVIKNITCTTRKKLFRHQFLATK